MPDVSSQFMPELKEYALHNIKPAQDVLLPRYGGYSLSNIPATVCKLLNIPEFGESSLAPSLYEYLGGPYKRVILLVVDALGYNLLNHLMATDKANFWRDNLKNGVLMPLTSVCPSTTASALTTLWTGVSPATHGIIGYEMWAKEYGMVINNILQSPMSFSGDVGGLRRAGFEPGKFLGQATLGTHMAKFGVTADAFLHYSIGNSGLSSMHLDQVNLHSYISESDLWVTMRNIINNNSKAHMFLYAYWGIVDTLTHRFSLTDERIAYQFDDFSNMIKTVLLNGLSTNARKDTLLILTADHGSVYTPQYPQFDLASHPDLYAMLRIQPTCENRLAFLYLRPGMQQAVRDYFDSAWPGKFMLLESKVAIEAGLFGPGPITPKLADRMGDLVAIARQDAYLWWAPKPNLMLGRHGGLHPDEMLIPFFALPL